MPIFELQGYGRTTNRKRTKKYLARDAEEAISKASEDDTIVDTETVKRVFPLEHFFSKVAGVGHENSDGSSRQRAIASCPEGEQLIIKHEPRNKYSRHALAVLRRDGQQLGYIPDETSEELWAKKKAGQLVICIGIKRTGGTADKPTHGLNLLILVAEDPETTGEMFDAYIESEVDLDDR